MKNSLEQNNKAIVLLSGGLDSTTTLALVQSRRYDCYALTVRYGQRHNAELEAAERIAQVFNVTEHKTFEIDLSVFGGSALTDETVPVPDQLTQGIPVTYVPARNTVFLSVALAWSEVIHARDIFIGVNAVDYSGYPDCRPEYIKAYQGMANLATKDAVEGHELTIHAPLVSLSKSELSSLAMSWALIIPLLSPVIVQTGWGRHAGHAMHVVFESRGLSRQALRTRQYMDDHRYRAVISVELTGI